MGETGLSWRIFSTFSDPCVSRRLHRSLYTSVTSCTPGIRWPMLYYNPEQYSRLEFCSFITSVTSCTPGIRWPMLYYNPEQYSRLEFCCTVVLVNSSLLNDKNKVILFYWSNLPITNIMPQISTRRTIIYQLSSKPSWWRKPCWTSIPIHYSPS